FGSYRLHLGTFPRPTGCVPCGGQPGEELEVTLLGMTASAADDVTTARSTVRPTVGPTVRVKLPEGGDDLFRFYPEQENGTAPTPILLRVGGPPNQTPTVDDKARAWIEVPGSVHGTIAAPGEVAKFYFHAKKGAEVEFRCVARSLRSPLDPTLTLEQATGRFVAFNDDSTGLDSVQRFNPPDDPPDGGDYVITVRDLLRRGGPDFFFRLEADARRELPTLRMVVGRNEQAVLAVPRGNRQGGVLQWTGLDAKEQLTLLARDLPAGVTATFGAVQAGTNLVPFVLTAAADAELGGSQIGFELRTAADAEPRDPGYAQFLPLILSRNDQPMLGTQLRQLPVAVTQPAPFAVSIEAPAVPIVRGAPLALRVHVVRAEGFAEPIRIKALWNPPGLTAGQVVIDKNSEQGDLPLSANTGAMLGRVPFAVVAQANSRGGTAEACSDFVDLDVIDPWLTADAGKARTEPGAATELKVALKFARPLAGTGLANLLALPRGVSCEPVPFGGEDKEVSFALQVAADAALGRHRSFVVQLLVPLGEGAAGGARVEHRFGGGEIRIDPPLAKVGEKKQ
ncbi:MAG: hypothetical protein ABIP94_24925, partial [Planctomycetota bacterium]